MQVQINNLTKALEVLLKQQKATGSPSIWAQLDGEIKDLESKIEEIRNGTTK